MEGFVRGYTVWILLIYLLLPSVCGSGATWRIVSSANGDLPKAGADQKQTGFAVGDFDQNGTNDFVFGFSGKAPALLLYFQRTNWTRLPIELEPLRIAPGGLALDIDRDGDQDAIFGTHTGDIYWWENPWPTFDPSKSWTRHLVRKGKGGSAWGEIAGDFLANGDTQLIFWDQDLRQLLGTAVPRDPRTQTSWPVSILFGSSHDKERFNPYGLTAADINADGQADLLAGNFWFKRDGQGKFKPTQIGEPGGLIASGRLNQGTYPQIVTSGGGRLRWFECRLNPDDSYSWAGHDLLFTEIRTLFIADLNQDAHDDIFVSTAGNLLPGGTDGAEAKSWIFYGDGRGNFEKIELNPTPQWENVHAADLNGDKAIDLVIYTKGIEPGPELWLNTSIAPSRPGTVPRLP